MEGHRAFADAALGLVGAPFRLQGRGRTTGLDCIGVIACALAKTGRTSSFPESYHLRGGSLALFERGADAHGFRRLDLDQPLTLGDVLLCRPGPAQFHLMVLTGQGLVHAHAGLGRVVLMPAPAPWPLIAAWRLTQLQQD